MKNKREGGGGGAREKPALHAVLQWYVFSVCVVWWEREKEEEKKLKMEVTREEMIGWDVCPTWGFARVSNCCGWDLGVEDRQQYWGGHSPHPHVYMIASRKQLLMLCSHSFLLLCRGFKVWIQINPNTHISTPNT